MRGCVVVLGECVQNRRILSRNGPKFNIKQEIHIAWDILPRVSHFILFYNFLYIVMDLLLLQHKCNIDFVTIMKHRLAMQEQGSQPVLNIVRISVG